MLTPSPDGDPFAHWLARLRISPQRALGPLLEASRSFLTLLALPAIPHDLRAKADAADLVQETFLEAQKHIDRFQGTTRQEFLGWLAEILRCRVANFCRDYHTAKRHVRREVSLELTALHGTPSQHAIDDKTPSGIVSLREEVDWLEDAISRLQGDYRRVVEMRYKERCSFEEIAPRLRRTPLATRQLCKRALQKLRGER